MLTLQFLYSVKNENYLIESRVNICESRVNICYIMLIEGILFIGYLILDLHMIDTLAI